MHKNINFFVFDLMEDIFLNDHNSVKCITIISFTYLTQFLTEEKNWNQKIYL